MANPYFNANYYLANNPDLFAAGINTVEGAWEHYVNYGAAEALNGQASRSPAPWFDAKYYFENNADLAVAGLTPAQLFEHFVNHGIDEGRQPSAQVELTEANLLAYAKANEDLATAFEVAADATELTDVQEAQLARHFYEYGYNEDREALPVDVKPEPNQGETFTLTIKPDDLVGTSGDDTFVAAPGYGQFYPVDDTVYATLQSADKLDGGAGNDTLIIEQGGLPNGGSDGSIAAPTITNIETIVNSDVRTVDGVYTSGLNDKTLNLSNVTGLGLLTTDFSAVPTNTGGNGYANYTGASADTVFGISNVQNQSDAAGGKAGINVAFKDAKVTTLNLELDGNAAGSYYSGIAGTATVPSTTLKAVNITSNEGNGGTIVVNNSVETITVDGAGDLAFENQTFAKLKSFDASDASGDIAFGGVNLQTADVELGLGAKAVTIATGSGDDTIDLGDVVVGATETVSVDAGAGDDTIVVTLQSTSATTVFTLTGGDGEDTFSIEGNGTSLVGDDDDAAAQVTIADFTAGEDTLELVLDGNQTAVFARASDVKAATDTFDADTTLADAFSAIEDVLSSAASDVNIAQFEFNENTYLVYGDGGSTSATFSAIELTGVDLGLTGADIVGIPAAAA